MSPGHYIPLGNYSGWPGGQWICTLNTTTLLRYVRVA